MLKSEKTNIRGTGYEVTQLPYSLGHKLLLRLYKAIGPAIAKALAEAPELPKGASLAEINVRDLAPALSAAVQGLADNLSEEDFDYAVDTLAEYTQISKSEGKWVPLKNEKEFHFAGNYSELFQWLGFALKVNYAGFTGEQGVLDTLLARVRAAAPQSQSTSIGTSTESQAPKGTQRA